MSYFIQQIGKKLEGYMRVQGHRFELKIPLLGWAQSLKVEACHFQQGFLVLEGTIALEAPSGQVALHSCSSCSDTKRISTLIS